MTRVLTASTRAALLADGRRAGRLRMAGQVVCGWPGRSSADGWAGRLRMAGEAVCGWRLVVLDGQRRKVGAIGVSAGRGQTPFVGCSTPVWL